MCVGGVMGYVVVWVRVRGVVRGKAVDLAHKITHIVGNDGHLHALCHQSNTQASTDLVGMPASWIDSAARARGHIPGTLTPKP